MIIPDGYAPIPFDGKLRKPHTTFGQEKSGNGLHTGAKLSEDNLPSWKNFSLPRKIDAEAIATFHSFLELSLICVLSGGG